MDHQGRAYRPGLSRDPQQVRRSPRQSPKLPEGSAWDPRDRHGYTRRKTGGSKDPGHKRHGNRFLFTRHAHCQVRQRLQGESHVHRPGKQLQGGCICQSCQGPKPKGPGPIRMCFHQGLYRDCQVYSLQTVQKTAECKINQIKLLTMHFYVRIM